MPNKNIPENQIHLWQIDTSHNRKQISQCSSLSESERARASSFKYLELGNKWAFIRQALREILAEYLLQPAEDIDFELGENNKPFIKDNQGIFFNLSHSHEQAIVGISSLCSIGVDIEKEKQLNEFDNIINRFFSEPEISCFSILSDAEKQPAFFRVWTRKEALIKANGMGMHMPLNGFYVPVEASDEWFIPIIRSNCGMNGHYYLRDVMISEEYQAALCLYSIKQRIEVKPQLLFYDYQPNEIG